MTVATGGTLHRDPSTALPLLEDEDWIALDLETSGLSPFKDKVAVITLYGAKSDVTLLYHCRGAVSDEVKAFLSNPRRKFIVHNGANFDIPFLAWVGVDVFAVRWYDSLVGECTTLVSGRRDYSVSLKATVARRLGKKLNKDIEHKWMVPQLTDEQVAYCTGDVRLLAQIRDAHLEKCVDSRAEAMKVEQALVPVVARMILNGLPFSIEAMLEYTEQQNGKIAEAEAFLEQYFGKINLGSPVQVKKAFAELGYLLPSTDAELLTALSEAPHIGGQCAKAVLLYRSGNKRKSMYDSEWYDKYITEGVCHSRFWQTSTDTTRFSSSDPNLQQVPKDARWLFRAPAGWRVVSCDYSQIEVRIAAALAGDEVLLEVLKHGDVHSAIASQVFGVPIDRVTDAQRKLSKAMSFTLLFVGGPKRLYEYASIRGSDITLQEARNLVTLFFDRFRGLARMREWAIRLAAGRGPVTLTLPNGHKRVLVGGMVTPPRIVNTLVQGTAAAGLKYALLEADQRGLISYAGWGAGAVVHDEIVSCVPEDRAEQYAAELEAAMIVGMNRVLKHEVKIGVTIGETW